MKRCVISAVLAAALLLSLPVLTAAAPAQGGERGVLYYEEFISPQYDDARRFSDGLAAVKKGEKWGYINLENEVVIDFIYDIAYSFSEGLAVVGTYDTRTDWANAQQEVIMLGRIDMSGNYKPFRSEMYDYASSGTSLTDYYVWAEGFDLTLDCEYYGGWVYANGLFDIDGNKFKVSDKGLIPGSVPTEGLVKAWSEGGEGSNVFLNMDGEIVLDLTEWEYFGADMKPVSYSDKYTSYRYISTVFRFNQGLAPAWQCTVDVKNDWAETYKLGFIDTKGNWVIAPQYDMFYVIGQTSVYKIFADNGLASVKKDGKYGAVDKTGKTVIDFKYDELWTFYEGRASFKMGELYGYIDSEGNEIIPASFAAASPFNDGCAVVYDGSKAYLIDSRGNKVPGAEIDPDNYFIMHGDGTVTAYSPGEYLTVVGNGKYGFSRMSYLPPLPQPEDMSAWAYEEVVAAIGEELVPVPLQNMYRSNITREEYSSLVVQSLCAILETDRETLVENMTGEPLSYWVRQYPFKDTASYDVAAAYALQIVTGYADDTFKPYNTITRQEAAVQMRRAASVLNMDTANPPQADFTDRGSIAAWAADSVDYVSSINVMQGTGGGFSPLGTYTREQSYMTVYRLLLRCRAAVAAAANE